MTQNEMPDEIVICPSGDKVWQEFDGATPELKYHHDRVVIALQERNARLVEALADAISKLHGAMIATGTGEEFADIALSKLKKALTENKE